MIVDAEKRQEKLYELASTTSQTAFGDVRCVRRTFPHQDSKLMCMRSYTSKAKIRGNSVQVRSQIDRYRDILNNLEALECPPVILLSALRVQMSMPEQYCHASPDLPGLLQYFSPEL